MLPHAPEADGTDEGALERPAELVDDTARDHAATCERELERTDLEAVRDHDPVRGTGRRRLCERGVDPRVPAGGQEILAGGHPCQREASVIIGADRDGLDGRRCGRRLEREDRAGARRMRRDDDVAHRTSGLALGHAAGYRAAADRRTVSRRTRVARRHRDDLA